MKLANNFLSATAMVATSEAVVMGVKSGLDPAVMIDVINAGSGMNTASRDKFPRAVLPRTFDFGFATGLMVKDVRLALEEMKSLGLSMEVAEAVGRLWEVVISRSWERSRISRPRSSRSKKRRASWWAAQRALTRRSKYVSCRPGERRTHISPMVATSADAPQHHNHGAGLSIAISASTSTRGRTTAYWSSLTSTSGTSARVL